MLHVGVLLGDPRLPYGYASKGVFGHEELQAVEHLKAALAGLRGFRFTYFDDHDRLLDELRAARPDLVLNLCDTGFRNRWAHELNLPALLELLEIPYTGSGPAAIALSNDKALVSAAARLRGIRVPEQVLVDLDVEPLKLPAHYPALLKPNVSCGSFGITEKSLVATRDQAEGYLRWITPQLEVREVLIQEFLEGDEYTVGVLGNPGSEFTVLPPLQVDWDGLDPALPRILTHGSKADARSPYWRQVAFRRADLDEGTLGVLTDACTALFARLGFRDYARFDFRCGSDGLPRLLDANVNPTWYQGGKMSVMAEWAGHDYAAMLRLILSAALHRAGLATPAA